MFSYDYKTRHSYFVKVLVFVIQILKLNTEDDVKWLCHSYSKCNNQDAPQDDRLRLYFATIKDHDATGTENVRDASL